MCVCERATEPEKHEETQTNSNFTACTPNKQHTTAPCHNNNNRSTHVIEELIERAVRGEQNRLEILARLHNILTNAEQIAEHAHDTQSNDSDREELADVVGREVLAQVALVLDKVVQGVERQQSAVRREHLVKAV